MRRELKLSQYKVQDLLPMFRECPRTIHRDTPMENVLEEIKTNMASKNFYVIDDQNRLIGSIRMPYLVEYLFPLKATIITGNVGINQTIRTFSARTAGDIMLQTPFYVTTSDSLSKAAEIMMREGILQLPVVNEDGVLIGQVIFNEIIKVYLDDI